MSFKCQVTDPFILRNINFRDGEIKTIEDLKKLISRVFRIDVSQFDIVNPPNEHQLMDMKGYDLKISIKKRCSNVQFRLPDGEIMYIQKCDKLTLDKVKEIIQKKGFKQDLKFSISGKDLLHIKYPFFAILPDTIVDVQKTVIIQYVILDFGQRTFRFPDKTPVNIAYREISNEYKNLTEYNLISISNVTNLQRLFGGERLKIEEKYSLTIICKYFFKIKTDNDYKMDQKFDFFAKIKDAKKRLSQALSCKKRNVIIYGKDSKEVQDDNLLLKDIRENEGTVYFNIFLKPKKDKKGKRDKRDKRDKKDKRKKPDKKYEHDKSPNKKNRDLKKQEKSEESPRKQNKEDDKKLLSKSNRPKIKSALMKSLKQIPDSDSDENDKITKKSEIKTKNSKKNSDEQENKNKLKNKQIQKKNQKRKFDLEEDNKSKNTKQKKEQKKKSNIEEDDNEEKTEKSVKIKFIFDENNEEIIQSFTKKVNIDTTIEELDEEISDIYDIDTKILIQHKFKNNKMTIDRDMTIEDVLEDIKEGNSNILYIKITENPKSKSSSKPNKSSNRTKSNQKESKLEKQKIKSNKKTKQESESESDDDDDFDDYKKKDKSSKKTSKTIKKESETESDDDDDFDDYKKKAKSPKKQSKTIKKESETESDDDDDYKKKAKSSKKSSKTIKKESESESDDNDDDLDYYKKKATSSKKPSKAIKKESESESDDHQKDDENEEDENNENEEEENNENEEEENNENEEEENNENEEEENNENEEDENDEDENDEDSESDDDDFDDVVVKPKQKSVNGKYKYYYQTNNDDEVKEIELKEGTNVKRFKEIIGKENDVENLADIKIIFAGKDLLNDIILDELNIGDTILFIYIRTIQDILLMTAKALQFKNEEEEEDEDD